MSQINLLPWREERRQELKQEFLVILAAVVLIGIGCLIMADRVVNAQIDTQNARNDHLQENIDELNEQVAEIRELQRKRNQLLDRMKVIQDLQGNRPVIVRILDQLVRTVPDGVFYTSLQSDSARIKIAGIAESNNRVSSLMRNLESSDWFADPNLDAVRAAPNYGDQANTFNLTVKVQLPDADGEND